MEAGMSKIRVGFAAVLLLAALGLAASTGLLAQSPPILNHCQAGAAVVLGMVTPGGGPVSIYDLSYPVRTKLGTTKSIDARGNFAAAVKPPLVAGHQIVAVDSKGATSNIVIVAPRPANPPAPRS
jgi:hypothetical protein